jgi:hypothetical protein
MQIQLSKLLLRYLVFIGIPYLIAKRLEKFLINRLDPEIKTKLNKELKRFPEIETVSENEIDNVSKNTKDGLNTRGGVGPVGLWFTKVVVVDFAVKVAIAGGIGATIWSNIADNAAANVVKFGTAILQAPGNKFKNFYVKVRGIDPQHTQDIREILLDKDLSINEKLELVRIKVEQTVKNLKGAKRTKFILFVMATLLFFFGGSLTGNVAAFTALMDRLRALLGMDVEGDLKGALIDVYFEYNAPFPEDLAKSIEKIK